MDLIQAGLTYDQLRRVLPKAEEVLVQRVVETLTEASHTARQLNDQRALSYAFGHLGQIYETAARHDAALQLTEQAIFEAQHVSDSSALYQWQWQKGRLLNAQGDPDRAIVAYQQAVATVQTLREALPCASKRTHTDIRSTLGPLFFQLADLLLQKPRATDHQTARQVVEHFKQAELQDYFGDVCLTQPPHANLVNIDEVSPTALVLYPIVLPDRLELLASRSGTLQRFRVPVTEAQLQRAAQAFRRAVQNQWPYLWLAQALYNWLIRPVASQMLAAPTDTLIFVPDGILRSIPFAALHDGERFLVEQYAVAMATSLQLTAPEPIEMHQVRILAAGASQFPGTDYEDLPYVNQELQGVAKLFPNQIRHLSEFRLTDLETAMQSEPFNVVHIASHSFFSSDISQSFILDAAGQQLTMSRLDQLVRHLQLRTQSLELLTLSACDTALGNTRAIDIRSALGLAGVAVQSGARSALATLWRINDQASAELIERFYQHLREPGVSRAQALQHAQNELLKHAAASYQHPYFWAPFVLTRIIHKIAISLNKSLF